MALLHCIYNESYWVNVSEPNWLFRQAWGGLLDGEEIWRREKADAILLIKRWLENELKIAEMIFC